MGTAQSAERQRLGLALAHPMVCCPSPTSCPSPQSTRSRDLSLEDQLMQSSARLSFDILRAIVVCLSAPNRSLRLSSVATVSALSPMALRAFSSAVIKMKSLHCETKKALPSFP